MAKNLTRSPILVRLAQIWAPKIFLRVLLPWDVRNCRKPSLHSISRKSLDPNSTKWQKTSFLAGFRPVRRQLFVLKIWYLQSLDIIISYHHVQYQKKQTNNVILRKLSDGQTDERADGLMDRKTDRQTNESDFIGRCPTNAGRPIYTLRKMCPNTELFLVRIFPHLDWIRRDTLRIQLKCGEIRTKNNSVFRHISHSDILR